MQLKDWMSVSDAAEVLGVSRETVRRLLNSHEIPSTRVGKKLFRIDRQDLEIYMTRRSQLGCTEQAFLVDALPDSPATFFTMEHPNLADDHARLNLRRIAVNEMLSAPDRINAKKRPDSESGRFGNRETGSLMYMQPSYPSGLTTVSHSQLTLRGESPQTWDCTYNHKT